MLLGKRERGPPLGVSAFVHGFHGTRDSTKISLRFGLD